MTIDDQPATIRGKGITRREGRTEVLTPQHFEWTGPGVVAVTGPNGSGKSTLLRIAVGLSAPSDGTVTIDGVDPGDRSVIPHVAYVPDAPVTFLDIDVDDQCRYVARLHGLAEPPSWTADLADAVGFGDRLMHRVPIAFSKGERQKASLLLHTSRPHRVLVLDEPSTGLDADAVAGLAEWVGAHAADHGVLVLVATHDDELIEVADEVHSLGDESLDEGS